MGIKYSKSYKKKGQLNDCEKCNEMHNIVCTGDVTRIQQFIKGVYERIVVDITHNEPELAYMRILAKDAMLFRLFGENTQFQWMALDHVRSALYCNFMDIKNDPYLQGMFFDALVPHVGPQDEPTLQQYIFFAIKRKLPTTTIEVFDKLWFKAYSGVSDDAETVNSLYLRVLEHKENTRISSFELAIQIGITRHILTLSSYAQDIDHILLDPYVRIQEGSPLLKLY